MRLITGEVLRNVATGEVFRIKLVGDRMVVLESEDKSSQVLTTTDHLRMFYQKKGFQVQFGHQSMTLPT